jgi:hypothetical protein
MGIDVIDRYIQGQEYLILQYLNPALHFLLFFQLQVGLLGGTRLIALQSSLQLHPARILLVECNTLM